MHHQWSMPPRMVTLLVVLTAGAVQAADANWPQWRGARLDGVADVTSAPVKWSDIENVVWRAPLAGPAGATPVVWGDRIFLTAAEDSDLVLQCIDSQGTARWKRRVSTGNKDVRGDEGNSASPSPSTDGEYVWTMMGTGVIACFDFDGRQVWKIDLQDRYGVFDIQFGMASTPVLDGDRLYLQLIHSNGPLILALDKHTGAEVWRAGRPSDARAECEHSYASPIIYRDADREFLVTHGADYVVAHRLKDGSEIWRCGGMNPKTNYNPTLRFIASPSWARGIIVVPSAKNGPVLGLRPDRMGDLTDSADGHLWVRPDNTPDVPSPLVVDDLVYLCRENGNLICLDAQTGEELYQERTHRERHRASPVYADGKIYLTARDGHVTVVEHGRQFKVLAENELQESISASPVFVGDRLYLRSFKALYAISEAE